MNLKELLEKRAALVAQMRAMLEKAGKENRDLNAEEGVQYDNLDAQVEALGGQIERAQRLAALEQSVGSTAGATRAEKPGAPSVLKIGRGDTEERAIAHYLRTGDGGGLRELRASNDTDMNITTPADGGYAVPTGHYQGIIARRDELMIANQVGVMPIPGVGTTVNVPVDNEADGEFVLTSEAAARDRDAPALDQKAMTLLSYTKKIQLSNELLQDQDSRLLEFLDKWVARGMAKTHNNLLVTEVLANGTNALTLDSATAIGAAEVPELVYLLPDGYEDGAAWIMRKSTEGAIRALKGDPFLFVPNPAGSVGGRPEIWGSPVSRTAYMPAIGTGNKVVAYGNFAFVGLREAPSLTFLRDPFGAAGTGQVNMYYYFRAVYKVLQPEAVLYAVHP